MPGLIIGCCMAMLFSAASPAAADTPEAPVVCAPSCILKGKASLEAGDYDKAVVELTSAYKEMPFLGDYILLWRAKAFDGKNEAGKALSDIRTAIKDFPDSPVIKSLRLKEIELAQKEGGIDMDDLFRKFMSDFPSEPKAKFAYAAYLKNDNRKDRAKALFKEIFLSVTPYSKSAGEELSSSEITAADLLKKGKNLNNAWLFKEAEKCFRDALRMKGAKQQRKEINEGLAYALFKQKKYRDAAALYSECDSLYWKAKSLFRAGDTDRFEAEMNRLYKSNDQRAAALFLAYGSKKRRSGDTEAALSIFDNVVSKFPSSKEDALWHKGWTYYRAGDYRKALDIFSALRKTYGSARYVYWENRCMKAVGTDGPAQVISLIPNDRNNNFYLFLSSAGNGVPVPPFERTATSGCSSYVLPKRVEVLEGLGFRNEALTEMLSIANRNLPDHDVACLSAHLKQMNDFRNSISMVARISYRDDLHELYYPPAYMDVIDAAAQANDIDPLLILSIMREESRFAPEARSPAGALGLMQLMPQTASRLSPHADVSLKHSEDLYDIRTNIYIGSYYLKFLIKTLNSVPSAVAAYNAGEDAVKNWMSAGQYRSADEFIEDIPYDETRNYVKKVLTSYFEYMRQNGRKDAPKIF